MHEIQLLMDNLSQMTPTGLISKAHGIAGRLEKQLWRGQDRGSLEARKQDLWSRMVIWQEHVGTAAGQYVLPPFLQSCIMVQSPRSESG